MRSSIVASSRHHYPNRRAPFYVAATKRGVSAYTAATHVPGGIKGDGIAGALRCQLSWGRNVRMRAGGAVRCECLCGCGAELEQNVGNNLQFVCGMFNGQWAFLGIALQAAAEVPTNFHDD
jgi:hypothetical protein